MNPPVTEPSRARGALIGLALGDAMGWPTEFASGEEITERFGHWTRLTLPDPAEVTDDTQMTLAVAHALTDTGTGLEPAGFRAALRERFIAWNLSPDNTRAPGLTCVSACRRMETGGPWEEAADIRSKGCGANMRVAPVGLHPGLDDDQRAGAAQLQAALTHAHPTALAASDLTAHAVHLLAGGTGPERLLGELRAYAAAERTHYRRRGLGDRIWRKAGFASGEDYLAAGWDETLAALSRLEAAVDNPDLEADPCGATGDGWIAEEALATALHCFLLLPDDPAGVLRRAAHTRGDSDSIAALAGSFAGARHGLDAWPSDWTQRVEYGAELLTLGSAWDL